MGTQTAIVGGTTMKDDFIELSSDQLGHVSGGFLGALLGLAGPIMNLVGGLVGKKKGGGDKEKQDDGVAAATAERDQALAQLKGAQSMAPNAMGEGTVQQRPAYG
jgi:hypothetical protein